MELYRKFVDECVGDDGRLKSVTFKENPNFNFGFDVVDYWGKNEPDRRAMIWISHDDEERIFTFGDIMKGSNRAANFFVRVGIKKGDKVMLVLRRHYQFWLAIVALHKIGAIVIPATDQLKTKDFVYRFNAAGVTALLCTGFGTVGEEAEEAIKVCDSVKLKMMANGAREGWLDFDAECAKESDVFERRSGDLDTNWDEPMLFYFTSGTSAYPKIACHTHKYALGHFTTAKWWHNVDPCGIHLTVAETGWGKAVWGKLYGQWLMGACILTYDFDKFVQDKLLEKIEKFRVTTFCAPPTIYRFLIKADLSRFDLSSLKYVTIAGEALNPEVFKQFKNATGLSLMEGFGQTETTCTIANMLHMTPKPGSMGKPNPQYKVCLLDADGSQTPMGEAGEICIDISNGKPFGLFDGYYRDEAKTNEAMHDGYYHTGDMAWTDEDGYFWYVGRTDDLIKSSGYRISPFEIESVIMEHKAVLECAVTAAPDEIRGQVVKATIVLLDGIEGTDELKKEIQTYVKNATAPYKYPRIVEFVKVLPKTISGKIRRTEIRAASQKNG